ncbi:MAG: hypothetical protein K6G72_08070 [Lachnospiraceae bacterium]|nr:hypothetical protein [Lachnospiraceae bacterium]
MDGMDNQFSYDFDLCRVCGKRHVDRSTGRAGEFMCRECRAEYSKLKVPKWLVACILLVCAAALAMCIYLGRMQGRYIVGTKALEAGDDVLVRAQELVEEHKQWSALGAIYEYLEENPSNAQVALEGMRMAMDLGFYDYAAYFENTYLLDKGFTDYELQEIYKYNDILKKFYDTNDAIDAVLAEFANIDTTNMSEEEIATLRKEAQDKIKVMAEDDSYDKDMACFAMAYLASDLSEVDSLLRKCVSYKPITASAASYLAKIERIKENFGAAESWIKQGEEVYGELIELRRVKATILLARGEYEEALSIMEELYSIAPEEQYVADTYSVALYALGKIDVMSRVIATAENGGYEFDEEFHALINGETTIRDYYVGED